MGARLCGLMSGMAFLLPVPVAAAAPLDFTPCEGTPDYECATFEVPLDPAGDRAGTLRLHARRLVDTRDAAAVMVALAGGPGQSSTRYIEDFADVLAEGLEDRQLVVLDQRGTGDSGALRCPALDRGPPASSAHELSSRVGRCGEELGEDRRFYTTTEVVADLDALRRALEVERISLFGVSYGTYVAQRYARRFPEHVDRLVLDSTVPQDQGGPFDRSSYAAVPGSLRRVCARAACLGITPDPVADLRRLLGRLRRGPLRGLVFDSRGRARRHTLGDQPRLFDLLVSSDLSPALRDAIPAALRLAARGDAAPLLRLLAIDEGSADPREVDQETESPEEFSNALFYATTCQEKPLPWGSPDVPRPDRARRRDAALDALGPRPFAPFGRSAYASTQVGTAFCEHWPETRVAPVPPPGAIGAPTLLLSGLTDLRTPPTEGLRAASLIPDASLVRAPGAGHSLLSTRLRCVQTALTRFFAGRAAGNPCAGLPAHRVAPRPAPLAPTSLRRTGRLGIRGPHARAMAAVLRGVADATRTVAGLGLLDAPFAFGGLRGGRACAVPGPARGAAGRFVVVTVERFAYVPDVAMSGRAEVAGDRIAALRVTVTARGRRGRLRLRGRALSGRLAGSPVRARLPRRALTVPAVPVAPSLESAARQACP